MSTNDKPTFREPARNVTMLDYEGSPLKSDSTEVAVEDTLAEAHGNFVRDTSEVFFARSKRPKR